MIDYIKNMLSKFCGNDETCLFIILALFGFLLCMILNRNEGFLNYASLDDLDNEEHNYGGDIGKAPSKIGHDPSHNIPINGYGPLTKKLQMAMEGKKYNSRNINQDGKLHVSQVGLPLAYDWGKAGGYYLIDGQPSSFGPDRPLDSKDGEFNVVGNNMGDKRAVVTKSDNKELELVLFYAPWCGHCKTLEPVYKEASNKTTHQFAEVNCDDEPELARMCNIEGFPTIKKLSIKEFKGDRNVKNLIDFAESK